MNASWNIKKEAINIRIYTIAVVIGIMKPKSNFEIKNIYKKKLSPYKTTPTSVYRLMLSLILFSMKLMGVVLRVQSFNKTRPEAVESTYAIRIINDIVMIIPYNRVEINPTSHSNKGTSLCTRYR